MVEDAEQCINLYKEACQTLSPQQRVQVAERGRDLVGWTILHESPHHNLVNDIAGAHWLARGGKPSSEYRERNDFYCAVQTFHLAVGYLASQEIPTP